jgi:L-fuconolactonase
LRIDSHQYFTPQHPPEHLKPILERNRFEGSIVLEDGPVPEGHNFIKGVIRRATPFDPKLGDRLDEWERDALFKGVRFTLAGALPWGLGELAHRGLSLDLELDAAGLGWVPRIAEAAPDLRIAIDDLANPPYGAAMPEAWAHGMEMAARCPQVYCKASNLIQRAPSPWKSADIRTFVQHALAVFGPERVMFGSGWPGCLPQAGWKETLAAFTQSIGAQSMEVREEVLGGVAARFYRVEAA